jgi:hypothetical protein
LLQPGAAGTDHRLPSALSRDLRDVVIAEPEVLPMNVQGIARAAALARNARPGTTRTTIKRTE